MICPRCGREISDTETICPFCFQDIDKNIEFNDFRKDGFIHISTKDETDTSSAINYMPKYFDLSEFSMFVIAVVFILVVSVFTLFSLKFVQNNNQAIFAEVATMDEAETEAPTETETVKYVENISIKNLFGSWRFDDGYDDTDETSARYLVFGKDGTAVQYYGTTRYEGTFKDVSAKDAHTVYINIPRVFNKTSFDFALIDNADGTHTLQLIDPSGYIRYLTKVKAARESTISHGSDVNVKLDPSIIGYWVSEDKKASYEFSKKANVVRITENLRTKGVWTITEIGTIEITYLQGEIKSVYLEYKQKDNKLRVNGRIYYKTAKH